MSPAPVIGFGYATALLVAIAGNGNPAAFYAALALIFFIAAVDFFGRTPPSA